MLKKKKGYHRHHIIPKYMGGDDSDENIIYLTPEEHAKAHLKLYEKYGNYEDAQAYNSLKRYWLEGRKLNVYKQSAEHIEKRISKINYSEVSKKLKGRVSPTKGMKFEYKPRPKLSEALKGKKKTPETIQKIRESLIGRPALNKIEYYCIYCRKRIPPSRQDRHGIGKIACISKNGNL